MRGNVRRKDQFLDDALEALDYHLELHSFDTRAAWNSLGHPEKEFIFGEMEKITSPITGSRYYLENYHVIATESEGLHTLFPFWESQEIFYESVIKIQIAGRPVKIVVLKARQEGLSTVCQGLVFHKTITTEVCNTLIVAQDPSQSDYLFGMSRTAYDCLPWWMRPEERYQAKGKYLVFDRKDDNERQSNPGLKSNIFVEAANKMSGVATGKTIRCAHLSELSRWQNAAVLSEQLLPAMNAPDQLAFMESTALGRQGFFYQFWKDAVNRKIDWEPVFIEFFRVKKYSKPFKTVEEKIAFALTPEEEALRNKVEKDKGFRINDETFNWRRSKIQETIAINGDEWKFFESYPSNWMEAFQGTGICAFNKRHLQVLLETSCAPPLFYGEVALEIDKQGRKTPKPLLYKVDKTTNLPPAEAHGSRLRIWELPEEQEAYYIGVDVAQGNGGDFSCAQIIKIGRGRSPDVQVAEWRGWINPTPWASVIYALGMWYHWAEISVETNDIGTTTNNELFRVLQYDKIYIWKHHDKIKNWITDFFGWSTNHKTRPAIIAKMREAIDEKTIVIRSEDLIDEMMDFAQSETGGKYQGQSSNDDRVMAFMICRYCAHDSDWALQVASTPVDAEKGKKDFFNTDFSPLHDRNGLRREMLYTQKVRAEDILYSDMQANPANDEDEAWKLM